MPGTKTEDWTAGPHPKSGFAAWRGDELITRTPDLATAERYARTSGHPETEKES